MIEEDNERLICLELKREPESRSVVKMSHLSCHLLKSQRFIVVVTTNYEGN